MNLICRSLRKPELAVEFFGRVPFGHCMLFVFSAGMLCATLHAYSLVHVWAPDAAKYTFDRPPGWITHEGRWLNYFLYPILKSLNAQYSLFLVIACLFVVLFIAAYRYRKSIAYAFAFSSLCIHALPLAHHLSWPSILLPAMVILLVAALAVDKLPISAFYAIFGILSFGSIQFVYFLLPLLHLPRLTGRSFRVNFRILAYRILPAWAAGFMIGALATLVVVYVLTVMAAEQGQIGLQISDWRRGGGGDWNDWGHNAVKSILALDASLRTLSLFEFSPLISILMFAAVGIALLSGLHHVPAILLYLGIILAHFVIVIPVGIVIELRTVLPAAIGLAALLFLTPQAGRFGRRFQSIVLLCVSAAWCAQSVSTLYWQTVGVTIYYNELLRTLPAKADSYSGVVLLNDIESIAKATSLIDERLDLFSAVLHVPPTRLWVYSPWSWIPIAKEAGFKDVRLCVTKHSLSHICDEANMPFGTEEEPTAHAKLYTVEGMHDGYIILRINASGVSLLDLPP